MVSQDMLHARRKIGLLEREKKYFYSETAEIKEITSHASRFEDILWFILNKSWGPT